MASEHESWKKLSVKQTLTAHLHCCMGFEDLCMVGWLGCAGRFQH